MPPTEKRRNWTCEEDLVLLIQAAADQLFAAEKGGVTKAWQALADTLIGCEHFVRVVDGRRVQNRFTALVEEHRRFDKASALLSGVCEEEKEKHVIAAAKKNDTASQDKDKVEQDALIVRDVAMRTLKRRKDCELDELKRKSPTENRRNSLAASIEVEGERELLVREKELEFQRFKFEAELKERERLRGLDREEMKAERDHQVLLARIESEKMLTMFKAVAEAKK
ncbi:hypothetical protein H257_14496 [Aphanomyces astaci]|uniref:Myb-like domain-containing protein n=1 Tax=Aphanomyces astaci TaxID=112090 RepID=W4FQX7_APHAT|nr:hypothetical protein H257_14496 [Aphanomyces astaci]ETV69897.1 hypothetical protein H257_14496 [Aphanomyces astaci]|eukprot:XP_009840635.1 hypothetical protein H257_14496 [Aphanomyces astaci]